MNNTLQKMAFLGAACVLSVPALAQAPAAAAPKETTICAVLANPVSFNGQIVKLKGDVTAGLDTFEIRDNMCKQPVNAIWLDYPEGTHGHAGPMMLVMPMPASNASFAVEPVTGPAVSLDKSKDWGQFDKLLSQSPRTKGLCLGCISNTVTATLVGRIDAVDKAGVQKDASGKPTGIAGFGNLRMYRSRLVLQSVSDITPNAVDYSKVADLGAPLPGMPDPASSGGGGKRGGGGGGGGALPASIGTDPAATVHQQYTAFPEGTPLNRDLKRASDAFPALGESNGVEYHQGIAGEVNKSETRKGGKAADGLAFSCTFDQDRLKGTSMTYAITHAGSEIADLHDPAVKTPELIFLEFHAWQTTLYSIFANRQLSAVANGGFVLWDSKWDQASSSAKANEGMRAFFSSLSFSEPTK